MNIPIILTFIGAITGFLYWKFYGCTEGCAITGKWYGSLVVGGLFGNLIGGMIVDVQQKKTK